VIDAPSSTPPIAALRAAGRCAAVLAAALALIFSACGDDDGPARGSIPDDFAVEYSWYEGSVAPPYHYEFDILVARDGSGTIRFRPDYGSDPEWVETFAVSSDDLDSLYGLMHDRKVFTRNWREDPEPPVGGSVARMTVLADGVAYEIPTDLLGGLGDAILPVYGEIESLVPEAIWRDLQARRDEYMDEYAS
jgi:hypothetical protein